MNPCGSPPGTDPAPRLIGIRLALLLVVPAALTLTSGVVDAWWWHTAQSNSRMLAGTLNRQIVEQVKRELSSLIASAEATHGALSTVLSHDVLDVGEPDKREILFAAQLQAQPALSWIAFGWPDGGYFATHERGRGRLEVSDIPMGPAPRRRRIDTYRTLPSGAAVQTETVEPTSYDVTAQPWYRQALTHPEPAWGLVDRNPGTDRAAIAYASSVNVDGVRRGVLAVMIDLDRLSRFLANLAVGRTGAAFVLASDGTPVVLPRASTGEDDADHVPDPSLLGAAKLTHDLMLAKADPLRMDVSGARVTYGGRAYTVTAAPLGFMDWEVTTVIPEEDFLSAIDGANRIVSLALILLVLVAATVSALISRHVLVEPLRGIVGDLGRIQRFEPTPVCHRPSRLKEFDALSRVVANMAAALAAFRKYLPADLVNTLIAEGVEASPGGTLRPMTILFADITGFTGMSERMGEAVFPLLARYIDVMSTQIVAHGGTIDKFMGDGVMAFWGAPADDPDQQAAACRAALACLDALSRSDVEDDQGRALRVRIGINSGLALVGNVGTECRLNYTVIGDAVNVASRIEALNASLGTSILVGEATRRGIEDAFVFRTIDRIALRGRAEAMQVHELLDVARTSSSPT